MRVVLRSKGGTSMVFFRKCYTTAIAKKPQKKVVFTTKLKMLVYFGGMGPVGGRVWNQGGQKVSFPGQKRNDFGGHFGTFSAFERRYF